MTEGTSYSQHTVKEDEPPDDIVFQPESEQVEESLFSEDIGGIEESKGKEELRQEDSEDYDAEFLPVYIQKEIEKNMNDLRRFFENGYKRKY